MNDALQKDGLAASDSMLERVDRVCDRFEAALQRGEKPRIDHYLESTAEPERAKLFEELLRLEVEYRTRTSEVLDPEEFCRPFPEYGEVIRAVLAETATFDGNRDTDEQQPQRGSPGPHELAPLPLIPGYEVLEVLGAGGMGIVYKARQIKPPTRLVALKMIRKERLAGADDVQRFRLDAQYAADVDHPSIVPIYELGEHQGQPFFSMKLIEGGSLAAWLADCRLQIVDFSRNFQIDIVNLMSTVARAVHHAHQRGILHRDLKPANILLDAAIARSATSLRMAIPLVADFGLAARLQGDAYLAESGAIAGTASYMATEQALGSKRLTTAVDVYGLGAILYELLTGQPPFRAATIRETLCEVVDKAPVPPRHLQRKVPRDLETICLKCLRKQPDQRYESALEVAEDLERFLAGKPIHGRPTSTLERAVKWAKRKPAVAALTAAVIVVGTLGLGAASWQWGQTAAARDRLENYLYFSRIALAERYLSSGNAHQAEEVLDLCPDALRNWEWYFLKGWCQRESLTLPHSAPVVSVALSPDGSVLATASEDGTVTLWDPDTAQVSEILDRHDRATTGISFSADGKLLATATADMTVKIWDVAGRQLLRKILWAGTLVALSADGKLLATAGRDDTEMPVKLWSTETGKLLFSLEHEEVLCLAFSRDGNWLAAGGRGHKTMRLWDVRTWKERDTFRGPAKAVYGLDFSSDCRWLATATVGSASVWNLATGQVVRAFDDYTGRCTCVAFGGHDQQIAAAFESGIVAVWDIADGIPAFGGRRHTKLVPGLSFSLDGRRLAFIRGRDVVVERLKAKTDRAGLIFRAHPQEVRAVALSPDGRRLASASEDGTVRISDAITGRPVLPLLQRDNGLVANRLTTSRTVVKGHSDGVTSVAFSPDSRLLASGSQDGTVQLWNAETGQPALPPLRGHTDRVTGVTFSPDGFWLASSSRDRTVRLWKVDTGMLGLSLIGHADYVMALAFSPDGHHLASACDDGTIVIWDLKTNVRALTFAEPNKSEPSRSIWSVAFSPDGRQLASASADGSVRIWDAASGHKLHALRAHTGPVQSVTFAPDGRRLVSAGLDRTVKIWDPASGQEVLTLSIYSAGVTSVSFSRDGRRLAAGMLDGQVQICEAPEAAVR
jgi:WD40 repeat protein/serine/threonine protein kinase